MTCNQRLCILEKTSDKGLYVAMYHIRPPLPNEGIFCSTFDYLGLSLPDQDGKKAASGVDSEPKMLDLYTNCFTIAHAFAYELNVFLP